MSSSKKSASKDVTVHESPWRGFDGDGEVIHQGQESLDFAFFAAARILDAPLPAGEPARSKMSALRDYLLANFVDPSPTASLRRQLVEAQVAAAVNMERSVAALGPALAEVEPHVSPQLARSMQSTENAWRDMETEFGMLSSLEVSKIAGSKSPNRSYASDQRAKGKLLAIKRPGGLRYPGFQIDYREHTIRPVMQELIEAASNADSSEADLALWLCSPTGYLDGARPVDQLDDPEAVVEAAQQSFNVEW